MATLGEHRTPACLHAKPYDTVRETVCQREGSLKEVASELEGVIKGPLEVLELGWCGGRQGHQRPHGKGGRTSKRGPELPSILLLEVLETLCAESWDTTQRGQPFPSLPLCWSPSDCRGGSR